MLTRKELAVIVIIAITIIFLFISYFSKQDNNIIYTEIGSIKCINESLDQWGIELQFSIIHPFQQRKLGINNLPEEFKQDGLKVKCSYIIIDVIGSSDWDIYIDIINISKTN